MGWRCHWRLVWRWWQSGFSSGAVASRSGLHHPFLICDSRCSRILHLYLFHGTRTPTPPTLVTPLSESRSRKVTPLRQRREAGGRRAYGCAAGSTTRVRATGGGAWECSLDRGVNKHEVAHRRPGNSVHKVAINDAFCSGFHTGS
jgi:hypothetical protein